MTRMLVVKLLRDLRVPFVIVAGLLLAFECLWAKVTQRITQEMLPELGGFMKLEDLLDVFFKGPGKIVEAIIGGEMINVARPLDVLSIGYVHPVIQTILCVWAIGRAAGAITGEIDRGTMELLLAQPLTRTQIILAHLCVDLLVIPLLCLAMWTGSWLGVYCFGTIGTATTGPGMHIDPAVLWPALPYSAALLFAVSGSTLWISAGGRFRSRVLGTAVLVTLLQFLVNLIGQLWPAVAPLRPFTFFYYYQPQPTVLRHHWNIDLRGVWGLEHSLYVNGIAVLLCVGAIGYALALWTFNHRDVPAPL